MKVTLKLESINPYITCLICKGYLIDATTVTECLHTFCKSCLIKHLDQNNLCPYCNVLIHRSHPLQHIKADRTLQDVIYKLVPNLHDSELERERAFYLDKGLPYPKETAKSLEEEEAFFDPAQCRAKLERDEKLCIQLETKDDSFIQLPLKFIICSSNTTVQHLKKLVAKKVFFDLNKYCAIDILCNEEILGQDHTLKFIYVSRWRFEQPPLKLFYMPRTDTAQG